LALSWDDVDLDESAPTLTVRRALQRHVRQQGCAPAGSRGLVFCQPNGRPLDPRADLRDWKRLRCGRGRPRRPVARRQAHGARHTAATMLLVQGVDPRTVMDLLGWSNITMTRRYHHVWTSRYRWIIERL
jgi:site-specific recombinase XerD